MLINGTQAGIFDRDSFHTATWNGSVGSYLVGFTLCLALFDSLAPIMFRFASATFFNISLLTSNFWSVMIGIRVFDIRVHWMYPIAFVCIIEGLVVYFLGKRVLGEARKPWLGKNQERGVSGIGWNGEKESGHGGCGCGAGVMDRSDGVGMLRQKLWGPF